MRKKIRDVETKLNKKKEKRKRKKKKKSFRVAIWNFGNKVSRSFASKGLGKIDRWIVILTAILLIFGVLMVFSASYYAELSKGNSPYAFLLKNSIMVTLGLMAMILVSFVDYRIYRKYYFIIGLGALLLLLLLFTPLGVERNNAVRWINLGVITLMPGEIAKMSIIIWCSAVLSKKNGGPNNINSIISISFMTAAYIGLIMWQPNMSTAMTIAFIVVAILFVAGLRMIFFTGMIGLLGAGTLTMILFGPAYRVSRLTTFLDPFKDQTGDSWQVVQSLLALGSGGMLGKGPGGSIQKALYLPEAHTDFILAIIGEELGFLGIAVMILVYAALIWRGLLTALNAEDKFGMYLASGIVMMIGIQVILNIAIVTSSMPPTGVALPFVSYGGNATIIYCSAVGILLNIGKSKNKDKSKSDFIEG